MNKKKKKMLVVINTLGMAGAESALIDLLKNIDNEKIDIYLYVIMNQGVLWDRIPTYVNILNKNYCNEEVLSTKGKKNLIKTVLKACLKHGSILKNFAYLAGNSIDMAVKKKLNVEKLLWRIVSDGVDRFDTVFDLAIAYLEGASTYYVADHVKAKKKAAFVHIDYKKAGYTRKLDKNCYDNFDKIFTVSDEVKQNYINFYPEYKDKVKVFHNIVDKNKIKEMSTKKCPVIKNDGEIMLLTVGRLTKQKAYDVAIDAMALIKKEIPSVKWYILGEGNQRDVLQKKINELGLQNDFILCGADSNPYPYFKECSIYVHATRFEGKSIAIQEAQTLGCVILASDCSGNREQIEDGIDGKLCELSAQGIKDGVINLIKEKEKWPQYKKASSEKKILHLEDLDMLYELCGLLKKKKRNVQRTNELIEYEKEDFSKQNFDFIKNPARGWYQVYTFMIDKIPEWDEFKWSLSDKDTLALVIININSCRDKDFEDVEIKNIRTIFEYLKKAETDIIVRFVYDGEGKGMENEPSVFKQILTHMNQTGPLLYEYRNIIHCMQGLFVGSWGEMHGSKFLSDEKIILLAETIMKASQNSVRLAVRKPSFYRLLKENSNVNNDMICLYDDAIMASETHLGTFSTSDEWNVEKEIDFVDKNMDLGPNGGETVWGENYSDILSQQQIIENLKKLHINYLNRIYDSHVLDKWKKINYENINEKTKKSLNEADTNLEKISLYNYIGEHIGYRFIVKDAFLEKNIFNIIIENIGFGNLINEVETKLVIKKCGCKDENFQQQEIEKKGIKDIGIKEIEIKNIEIEDNQKLPKAGEIATLKFDMENIILHTNNIDKNNIDTSNIDKNLTYDLYIIVRQKKDGKIIKFANKKNKEFSTKLGKVQFL